ncbi:urease accessory protein UreD [Cognatishimia sp. SS12]|nr:urease accessory protein UreD [Cognatishimia sp. SS12]
MPRTQGMLTLSSKRIGARSGIDRFRAQGAMKGLFSRGDDVEAILINTSGGLTSGDQLTLSLHAGPDSKMTATTQAAERAYRADAGRARVSTHLQIDAGGQINWLPQELILFEGCKLNRSLTADLAPNARLLMVEPVVFGRAAMGETLKDIEFEDRIRIHRDGAPLYNDALRLMGDMTRHLAGRAVAQAGAAMASVVYVAPDAMAHLAPIRAMLPQTAGASLLADDLLAIRLIAADSYELRRSLLPVLDRLSRDGLPTSWRL